MKESNENVQSTPIVFSVVGSTVLLFALEGLFLLSMVVYGRFFYWLVAGHPAKMYIGSVTTYSIFVLMVTVTMMVLHRFIVAPKREVHSAFVGVTAFLLVAFPITPILWYLDPYLPGEVGWLFGFQLSFWPIIVLTGIAMLLFLWRTMNTFIDLPTVFVFILFSLILIIGYPFLYLQGEMGYLHSWATPFYILPHVAGFGVLGETIVTFKHLLRPRSKSPE
jgi:hypothetical protein